MAIGLFDVKKQLTFYGAYHSSQTNVLIHKCCVPVLLWTFQTMIATLPTPSWMPTYTHVLNPYMTLELNWTTVFTVLYLAYYYALEPLAALLYTPQMMLSLLTATSFAHYPGLINVPGIQMAVAPITLAGVINGLSWIAQFVGHGKYEGRAPALLDNLVGALVLAPFFVHLELLFDAGYRPAFHKELTNEIGKEIVQVRKAEADRKRAANGVGKKEL